MPRRSPTSGSTRTNRPSCASRTVTTTFRARRRGARTSYSSLSHAPCWNGGEPARRWRSAYSTESNGKSSSRRTTYVTGARSPAGAGVVSGLDRESRDIAEPLGKGEDEVAGRSEEHHTVEREEDGRPSDGEDRKSTRLNSSHV